MSRADVMSSQRLRLQWSSFSGLSHKLTIHQFRLVHGADTRVLRVVNEIRAKEVFCSVVDRTKREERNCQDLLLIRGVLLLLLVAIALIASFSRLDNERRIIVILRSVAVLLFCVHSLTRLRGVIGTCVAIGSDPVYGNSTRFYLRGFSHLKT